MFRSLILKDRKKKNDGRNEHEWNYIKILKLRLLIQSFNISIGEGRILKEGFPKTAKDGAKTKLRSRKLHCRLWQVSLVSILVIPIKEGKKFLSSYLLKYFITRARFVFL